ncbi:hypothetical protein NECAME_17966 [Necator americanus]|uniref:ERAP1-like C-terminal domain-containing protein n=1 Tax=Necator americanus TaxID=51031 RepID=W2TFV5_NECAM|nr:hypothetical protein NECAME_17966 [Necator americanus]ETN80920.1 hypothetical protein NECAME_17966 [Necator americanus]
MDRMVWQMIHKHVKYIGGLIEETPFAHIFEDLQRALLLRPYDRVGWNSNTSRTPSQKGLQSFQLYKNSSPEYVRPPPELLGVVLDEGVRQGGTAAWDRVYAAYLETKNPTERVQLIGALASTKQQSLISK